jgi:hypothetical protein
MTDSGNDEGGRKTRNERQAMETKRTTRRRAERYTTASSTLIPRTETRVDKSRNGSRRRFWVDVEMEVVVGRRSRQRIIRPTVVS